MPVTVTINILWQQRTHEATFGRHLMMLDCLSYPVFDPIFNSYITGARDVCTEARGCMRPRAVVNKCHASQVRVI